MARTSAHCFPPPPPPYRKVLGIFHCPTFPSPLLTNSGICLQSVVLFDYRLTTVFHSSEIRGGRQVRANERCFSCLVNLACVAVLSGRLEVICQGYCLMSHSRRESGGGDGRGALFQHYCKSSNALAAKGDGWMCCFCSGMLKKLACVSHLPSADGLKIAGKTHQTSTFMRALADLRVCI